MNVDDLSWIENRELLSREKYPRFTSFHDSEVVEFHYWIGRESTEALDWKPLPILTLRLKIPSNAPDPELLAILKFEGVRDFSTEKLSWQNPINGLTVRPGKSSSDEDILQVMFERVSGFELAFACERACLVEVTAPADEDAPILSR